MHGELKMSDGVTDLLVVLLFSTLAILFAGVGFVAASEGWRRWSENRRIRKHFQH
jgi:hypothetical protein